ncbi:phospholipase-like protein, partial [Tanacetum coccineum]
MVPKQRVSKTTNKGNTTNLSPLNLGGVFEGYNEEENNVKFLGSQFTGNILFYENVDPAKHMNAWMELMIRRRPSNANWTVAYTSTISVHPENNQFILHNDPHVFLPIHVAGNHWATSVIHLAESHFYVFDSMASEGNKEV